MPLLGARGGGAPNEAPADSGSTDRLEPSGPAERPMMSRGSSRMLRGSRAGSLVDLSGDHFAFGEIQGLGRAASAGGLLPHHEFFNRGHGLWQEERERLRLPALVDTGRYAGRSRVKYRSVPGLRWHLLRRDFFISLLQVPFLALASWVGAIYLGLYLSWGAVWFLVVRFYPGCLYGATTFVEAFTFATITQMTIGYGNTGPQQCWVAALIICVQVANPKYRAHSIYISDSAVITRRDGLLKVIEPRVRAFLYTWGEGRLTAEGERIPVRCEQLDLAYIDGMLLLPLIIEHTIDERSPLCGHTYDSLAAMSAEVVVTFEATTEMGNPFFARQSYLAQEIAWGGQFEEVIKKPEAGEEAPRYRVQLDRFHDVRCPLLEEAGDEEEARSAASQQVVNRAKRAVPYPLLGENTLVLSDLLCVRPAPGRDGAMELVCRLADTYPSQMIECTARIYLYRWRPLEWSRAHPRLPPFTLHSLDCGYKKGLDRVYLRLPTEVVHRIDAASPLARWLEAGGLSEDADSEIVVVVQGYSYVASSNRMRQRTYRVGAHVRYGFTFAPTVRPPHEARDGKPRVRWSHFFDIQPVAWSEEGGGGGGGGGGGEPPRRPMRPTIHLHASALRSPALQAYLAQRSELAAPESHAPARAQQERNATIDRALDSPRSTRSARWAMPGGGGGGAAARAWARQPFGPAPQDERPEPAASISAAAAPGAPEAGAEGGLEGPLEEAGVPAELAAVADRLGRSSSSTPDSPLQRYQPDLARSSALPGPPPLAVPEQPQPAAVLQQHRPAAASPASLPRAAASVAQQQPSGLAQQELAHLSAPPELGTVSESPEVPLERYVPSLARPSLEPAAVAAAEPAASSGSGIGRDSGSGSSQHGGQPPAPPTPGVPAPRPGAALAPLLLRPPAEQQARQQQARQQQALEPPPELLPSDLSVTPSVDLSRYAAQFAAESPRVSATPGRPPRPPGGRSRLRFASEPEIMPATEEGGAREEEEGREPSAVPVQAPALGRDPSWHRRRSLAQLSSIFEQQEGAERAEGRAASRSGTPPGN